MNFEHDNLSGGQENLTRLAADIKSWGRALGFDEVGITDTGLSAAEVGLAAWLEAGCHGQMDYMYKHGLKRSRPEALVPGTRRVISARMSYLPDAEDALAVLNDPARAYVSRYALGRDYHKVLRARLQRLADRIAQSVPHAARVFVDSAPVMEVALAEKAGWAGGASTPCCCPARRGRSSFWARSTPTCCCRSMRLPTPTAEVAAPASRPARPGRSLHPTGSTPVAASRI
jgi:epoxyqueuosine reductase